MSLYQQFIRAFKSVLDLAYWPRLVQQRESLDRISDWNTLIDEVCRRRDRRSIFANQIPMEIGAVCDKMRKRHPKVIVEIGTSQGGTLYLFSRLVEPGGLVISIDKPGGPGSVRYIMRTLYQTFGRAAGTKVITLDQDSHSPKTHAMLERLLNGRQIDLLFIDGDHSYDGVKADFHTYRQWMSPEGVIALHDIEIRKDHPTIQVPRFWQELISSATSYDEFVQTPGEGPGIGVVSNSAVRGSDDHSTDSDLIAVSNASASRSD